jgi:ABC-2 type transport system ATP-binding protein
MGVRPTPTLTLERTQNPAVTSSIELQGLRKSFRTPAGIVDAVRGVDVVVAPGETLALLGPNGAGKSTTIDLMLGLQRPDGGTAMLFGRAPGDAVAQGRIGVMLQSGGLLRDLTVRELVTMMAALYPAPLEVDDALALAGATEIAGRRTEKLSGGERQRVRFAVSLVGDPELLVLDEPTAGMDVEARHRFWTAARNLAAWGRTILFATHYLEEADDYADRVVLMSRGQVVADGPPTEIKSMVGTRTIRATLPGAPLETLERLPGVTKAERRGEAIVLVCSDSDAAVRALLAEFPGARDIEIEGAGLEDAFLRLTADAEEENG